jgi:S-DNA-T family DNA segregation ATPase FtsK/SpoIIIE
MNPRATFRDYDARARARIIGATTGRPGRTGLAWRVLVRVVRFTARRSWLFTKASGGWAVKNPGLPVIGLVLAMLWHGSLTLAEWPGDRTTSPLLLLVTFMTPGLFLGLWAASFPRHYRRKKNARDIRRVWPKVANDCGLGRKDTDGTTRVSRLRKVIHQPGAVVLRMETFPGQTVDTLRRAAPALTTAYGAYGYDTVEVKPRVLDLVLFTTARLAPRSAVLPHPEAITTDVVPVGRTRGGDACTMQVIGRHTLVVGASGAGKGSVLWSVVGGLAPAIHAGIVRLWGVDLKKGLEVETGRGLFGHAAYSAEDALEVLRSLLRVIDERGAAMRGVSRLHVPAPGDPLHVLVIDELADLMAYSDSEIRREAERLVSKILTQGRALGVVVVACVQNPRQESLGGTRSLYTQRIALRLDSDSETDMVLGGLAVLAPAHTINKNDPGTAYLVTEDGTPQLVRFDYWPDDLIRLMAVHYAAPADHAAPLPRSGDDAVNAWARAGGRLAAVDTPDEAPADAAPAPVRKRKPRGPRKPRPVATPAAAPSADAAPAQTEEV